MPATNKKPGPKPEKPPPRPKTRAEIIEELRVILVIHYETSLKGLRTRAQRRLEYASSYVAAMDGDNVRLALSGVESTISADTECRYLGNVRVAIAMLTEFDNRREMSPINMVQILIQRNLRAQMNEATHQTRGSDPFNRAIAAAVLEGMAESRRDIDNILSSCLQTLEAAPDSREEE